MTSKEALISVVTENSIPLQLAGKIPSGAYGLLAQRKSIYVLYDSFGNL